MCTGRIECSFKTKVQFMCCTLCWVWFKTFYIICTLCVEVGNYPRLARSQSVSHSMNQSQQESISGQATWQARQVSGKKQRKIHEKAFKKRVASWQKVKFWKEKAGVSSSHVWYFKLIDLPWKRVACKHVRCCNMLVVAFDGQDIKSESHKSKLCP